MDNGGGARHKKDGGALRNDGAALCEEDNNARIYAKDTDARKARRNRNSLVRVVLGDGRDDVQEDDGVRSTDSHSRRRNCRTRRLAKNSGTNGAR